MTFTEVTEITESDKHGDMESTELHIIMVSVTFVSSC
jgi:hypothetical protein